MRNMMMLMLMIFCADDLHMHRSVERERPGAIQAAPWGTCG